ncbi:MAG: hypothetical protein O3B43_00260 [Chloroflexi bacterium]|nr:hypothetical protein [Chloroflexota bacterium]
MQWIETFLNGVPTPWAVAVLVAVIGLSVLTLRGLIRLAFRAFFIGVIGLAVLGVVYFVF